MQLLGPETSPSLPLAIGLGLRIIYRYIKELVFASFSDSSSSPDMQPHARAVALGIWEGFLIYYLIDNRFSKDPTPSPEGDTFGDLPVILTSGLLIGLSGRMMWDYSRTGDVDLLARGFIGIALGIFIAELAKHGFEELYWRTEWGSSGDLRRRHRHRRMHRVDEEIIHQSDAVPVLPAPEPIAIASTSQPGTRTARHIPPDILRSGRRDIDEGEVDEVASLEKEATAAAGQQRRLKEEREWAQAQGNSTRSFELESEIKRYQALSKELERKLRHKKSKAAIKQVPPPPPPITTQRPIILVRDGSSHRSPQLIQVPFNSINSSAPVAESSRRHRHHSRSRSRPRFVPIRPGPPTDSTAPDTSDDWSRQLD